MLEIDKDNRRLSLGHKQLEDNPWNDFEHVFTLGSIHKGTITDMVDKGALVSLAQGVEGFATPTHLVKEDGSQAQKGETLDFKVIEFNKDSKRIIVSHSRISEDATKAERRAERVSRAPRKEKEESVATPAIEKTTLGDLDALQALKEQLKKEEDK